MGCFITPPKVARGRRLMCIMVADTEQELHTIVKRAGFTGNSSVFSETEKGMKYYLIPLHRVPSVECFGVIRVSSSQLRSMLIRKSVTGSLGDPETAESWVESYRDALKYIVRKRKNNLTNQPNLL